MKPAATRRSSFSPIATRVVSGTAPSSELELSRIARKLHLKIQTTSTGCYAHLFLLVAVPDTYEPHTSFPLLADRHIELREWHIHNLDAHWAAPALSESAARAAAVFKIPVSTDLALDDTEPTNAAVLHSTAGTLNLVVPAGTASTQAQRPGPSTSLPKAAHAEHDKRGYLISLVMELDHIRASPEWPLQVTLPVPRCLMNTLEFRISSSDHVSARESPVRIHPKLISTAPEDATKPGSSSPNAEGDASTARRCSVAVGPKIKGVFTATSFVTLAWLRGSDEAHNVALSSYLVKSPSLRSIRATNASIETEWTHCIAAASSSQQRIAFNMTCTLSGITHLGIDERAFVKLELRGADEDVLTLQHAELVTSNSKLGMPKGVVALLSSPPAEQSARRPSTGPATSTSRIPSRKGASSAPSATRAQSARASSFDMLALDTSSLEDTGDLMQVAPPKGLFSHDLSFSVDHQAYLDDSAIADMSNIDRIKQFAAGNVAQSVHHDQSAKGNRWPNVGGALGDDLPPGTLTDQRSIAVVIDVDEALGVVPSRLKDVLTIRLRGTATALNPTISSLQGARWLVPVASHCHSESSVGQDLQRTLDLRQFHEAARTRQVMASAGRNDVAIDANETLAEAHQPSHLVQVAKMRNVSSDSIQTPIKHSNSTASDVTLDQLGTPTRTMPQGRLARPRASPSTSPTRDPQPGSPPEFPMLAGPLPDIHTDPNSHASADASHASTASCRLNSSLNPELSKALRKRALSEDRSGLSSIGPRLPSSPPHLGGPAASYASDESIASVGSAQKRGEWHASSPSRSVAGAAASASESNVNPLGRDHAPEPGRTTQDLSVSTMGDQSLSHSNMVCMTHETLVEVVPVLRQLKAVAAGPAPLMEFRAICKIICPSWPCAELDGRSVLVPSVAVIMSESDEVVSVWCDHGRLKWSVDRHCLDSPDDYVVTASSQPRTSTVQIDLPATLRNNSSNRRRERCKLEIRVASRWTKVDADQLKRGMAVHVNIPVLKDCVVGTLHVHFCKPADGWPAPTAQLEDFRTYQPTDVKAYLTRDDVQADGPLRAELRYARIIQAREQSSGLIKLALLGAMFAGLVACALLSMNVTQQPAIPIHLVELARQGQEYASAHEVPTVTVTMALPLETHQDRRVPDRTQQEILGSTVLHGDPPSEPTLAGVPAVDEHESKAEQRAHDAADDDDPLHSLLGPPQSMSSMWRRVLESFLELFRWMRRGDAAT